jgi:hypothetical protein
MSSMELVFFNRDLMREIVSRLEHLTHFIRFRRTSKCIMKALDSYVPLGEFRAGVNREIWNDFFKVHMSDTNDIYSIRRGNRYLEHGISFHWNNSSKTELNSITIHHHNILIGSVFFRVEWRGNKPIKPSSIIISPYTFFGIFYDDMEYNSIVGIKHSLRDPDYFYQVKKIYQGDEIIKFLGLECMKIFEPYFPIIFKNVKFNGKLLEALRTKV